MHESSLNNSNANKIILCPFGVNQAIHISIPLLDFNSTRLSTPKFIEIISKKKKKNLYSKRTVPQVRLDSMFRTQ